MAQITECRSPAAIKDFETAKEHSENDRQIKEGLERAQRLLKQSQKRDYYKILGVKRLDIKYYNLKYLYQSGGLIFILIKSWLQDRPEKRDLESLQEVSTAVASGQFPKSRRKEKGREEVHRHRSSQRSSN